MLTIDGSRGEGGGQILRTSLALSLVTGTPVRLVDIRAKRAKPGLLRQHLAAVRAAAALGATVEGAELGAREIVVRPGAVRGGDHVFAVGSAGSAGLVLQTVLPPLLASGQAARLRLEGGTHNPAAPPFDFLERVFAPVLARMGAELTLCLERWGFYPAGGGAFTVEIGPCGGLRGVEMTGRGEILRRRARAVVAHLRPDIARRELEVVRGELGFADDELEIRQVRESDGPGNVLLVELEGDGFRELVSAFGERGVSAESVARRAVDAARAYASADAPIGVALADQLLLPFALAGEGVFRTVSLSEHTRTNLEIVREFLPVRIEAYEESDGARVAFHS